MRRTLTIVMLAALVVAALLASSCSRTRDMLVIGGWPDATGIDAAAAETETLVLPTTQCGYYFIAETYVDGAGPFAMMLDTGASTTTISPQAAAEAGVGSRISQVAIGDLKLEGRVPCSVRDVDHLGDALGIPIDGILAHSVFRNVLLTYDFPGGEVRARIGQLTKEQPGVAPMSTGRRPFLGAKIGEKKVNILLDTGSSSGLTLSGFDNLAFTAPPRTTRSRMRLKGLYPVQASRLRDDVRFGSFTLTQPIAINAVKKSLVGQKILHNFVVTLDQQQGLVQMVHADGTASDEPIQTPPLHGAGWILRPEGDRLIVVQVLDNTAAAAAGFQPDDVIVAIDGVPLQDQGCRQNVSEETEPTRKVYQVERNGETLEVEMTTAVLVK